MVVVASSVAVGQIWNDRHTPFCGSFGALFFGAICLMHAACFVATVYDHDWVDCKLGTLNSVS